MNKRKNCPSCSRPNSVRILEKDGKIVEHCFGVDCQYYKAEKKDFEIVEEKRKKYLDKDLLLEARSHPDSLKFMQKYFISESNANVYYYPLGNRVVFNYKDLYVGRSLDSSVTPKWYVYAGEETPFVVQKYRIAKSDSVVLVEDCVSACNASRFMDSIALLGTSLRDSHLTEILKYDTIYIALDQDATTKAMKMQRVLEMVKECKVVFLEKDIKYLTLDELESLFR